MAVSVHAGRGRPGASIQDGDDVTRYLCAAAYLDRRFAQDVVDELVLDPYRAVAPAPGVDQVAVAQHCLAAGRQSLRRDLLLTGIVLLALLLAGIQGLLIVIMLFAVALLPRALRLLGDGEIGRAVRLLAVFGLLVAVCLVGLLLRSGSGSSGPLGIRLQSTLALLLVVAGLWIVAYLDRIASYAVLSQRLAPGTFDPGAAPEAGARWRERLEYVRSVQHGGRARGETPVRDDHLSVYAHGALHAPFTGFGPAVHTWSVSARLEPAQQEPVTEARTPELSIGAFYARLRTAGASAGCTVSDLVLMPGWLPGGHPFLDPAHRRPVPRLTAAIVEDIAVHPGGPESYHQVWSASTAGTQLLVTGFVQASVREGQLAVDVALTVLPPVPSRYRAADRCAAPGVALMFAMLAASLADVGRRTPQAPVNLIRSAVRAWRQAGTVARAGPDVGARAGVHELAVRREPAQEGDYEATRQVNQLSRELAAAISRVLAGLGFDQAGFSAAAGAVWQKPLRTPGGPTSQVRVQ